MLALHLSILKSVGMVYQPLDQKCKSNVSIIIRQSSPMDIGKIRK